MASSTYIFTIIIPVISLNEIMTCYRPYKKYRIFDPILTSFGEKISKVVLGLFVSFIYVTLTIFSFKWWYLIFAIAGVVILVTSLLSAFKNS